MKHSQLTEELREQALLYASGAMPAEEQQVYARHLEEGCSVCLAECREFESVAQSMIHTLDPQSPSAAAKARLMAQAEAVATPQPRRSSGRAGWLVAAAAAAAVLVLFVMNTTLRQQVQSLTLRVTELESQAGRDRSVLAMLTGPQVRVVDLSGVGNTPQARARIFSDDRARLWRIYVDNLPPAGPGRSYQLWFVPQTGNPVSARVFNTNPDGAASAEISVPPEVTTLRAAAVTNEPEGGRPQPSDTFVLMGAMD
jgi:anti-sigma-K factor RskA